FCKMILGVYQSTSHRIGDKKNGANDRIRQGGLQPAAEPERSEGNRLIVRIGYWRQPMSKAEIQNTNICKIYFARCFWGVSKQFSQDWGQKKWSQ
ncbi:MAG: hypothetical protein J6S54_07230, partial [Lentisphaeria bacterium]|nr:hypothetical protein [Lentisphaeria bacterium]